VKSEILDIYQYSKQFQTVVAFEPLAQTQHGKMWRWKAKSIEYENDFIATSRRARAGLNPEPRTDQFRSNIESLVPWAGIPYFLEAVGGGLNGKKCKR
jgi:hypothetical protein